VSLGHKGHPAKEALTGFLGRRASGANPVNGARRGTLALTAPLVLSVRPASGGFLVPQVLTACPASAALLALPALPGPQGERGPEGPPGKLPIAKAWTDGIHYEGAVVVHLGATYQATKDTAKEPGHADWMCLAASGRDGVTPEIRGTFDASQQYRRLDIVALNGGSFVALKDDPGACPGAGWQLVASPGKRGEKGPQGDRGEKGLRGEAGAAGATIVGWRPDLRSYTVTPIMSDGAEGPPLDMREFFQQFELETR
jgi:hypothetical protein